MLGKLLKYELKSTVRTFGAMYLALCSVALILGITLRIQNTNSDIGISEILLIIVYAFMVGAVFFVTLYMILQRFYRNLLQEQGYLMHTLPVHEWQHILSKLLIALLWIILSMLAVFVSALIITLPFIPWAEIVRNLPQFNTYMSMVLSQITGISGIGSIFFTLFEMLLGLINGILLLYMALAIGNLFNKHKKVMAFVAFLVANYITSWIDLLFLGGGKNIFKFSADTIAVNSGAVLQVNLINLGLSLVWSIIFFVVTEYILRKRLNLE